MEVVINKKDGSCDDVSLLVKCVSGKTKDNLYVAMRKSILDQIYEYKNSQQKLQCVLCEDDQKIHVDHFSPQFIEMYTEFINKHPEYPTKFDKDVSHACIFREEDREYEIIWKKFHRENANLRILCQRCNLTRKKVKR